MQVLVTGATGFLGRTVVNELTRIGDGVLGIDAETDLRDARSIRNAITSAEPDAVVHLGGISGPMVAHDDPPLVAAVNAVGTVNVLDACQQLTSRPHVILASSVAAVEQVGDAQPSTVYAATKRFAEDVTRVFGARGLPQTIVRIGSLYGPGRETQHIITDIATSLAIRGRATLVDNAIEPLVHVEDAARFLVRLVRLRRPKDHPYTLVQAMVTHAEIARHVAAALDVPLRTETIDRAEVTWSEVLDSQRLLADTGLGFSVALHDGIAQMARARSTWEPGRPAQVQPKSKRFTERGTSLIAPHTRPEKVIRGGHVIAANDAGEFDVGIAGEQIVAIGAPGTVVADEILDASGCIVMPGGIDPHTHITWPFASGGTGHDTFASATTRAAAWGTTSVIDFVPGRSGSLIEAAEQRLDQAAESVIDYTFHPVITELNADRSAEIVRLIGMGLSSFKVYTTYDSRLEVPDIRRFIQIASDAGGLPGFHAEHHGLLEDALGAIRRAGSTSVPRFPASRPGHTERASIREIVGFAEEFSSPVYIYHVSGLEAFSQIEEARSVGVDVRAETCAHYLVHDDTAYQRDDGWKYVITPPIRSRRDQSGLWQAIAAGTLNAVASDHCCYSQADKAAGFGDFTAMEPGAPGIASRMPMLWNFGVAGGRLTTRQFVDINARIPAEAFGLRNKGRIDIGADADIVIWDPNASWTWNADDPATSNGSDYDIYDGISGVGQPRHTLSRGRSIFGAGMATTTRGRFIEQQIR